MAPFTRSNSRYYNNNSKRSSGTLSEHINAILRERSIPTSSRKRGRRLREMRDDVEAIHPRGTTRKPSFTKVLKGKTAHHSAYCCRLSLPRKFCEEHEIPRHVTMTDSTGSKQWHMRFQVRRAAKAFTISNGWREFSYDHSLKTRDELVFTLVSPSHFRVRFGASRRTRAMYPTRDGDKYPWKINYSRLACLSPPQRNIRKSKEREKNQDKDSQEEARPQTPVQPPEARPNQGMENATTFDVQNIVSVPIPETLNPADENSQVQFSEDQLSGGGQKHSQLNKPIAPIPNKSIISLSDESEEEEETFCQCKPLSVMLGECQPVASITHLECKNLDGTTYVQICDDSDSEITD